MASLKLGDEVAWKSWNGRWSIVTVTHIKATQLVTSDGFRWNLKTGREWGSTSNRAWLKPVTDEARDFVEHQRLSSALTNRRWEKDDLPTLRRVAAALAEVQTDV